MFRRTPLPVSHPALRPAASPRLLNRQMKLLAITLLSVILGFVLFVFCGYWMMLLLSSSTLDSSIESIMTAVFVIGPLGAIAGALVGIRLSRPTPGGSAP